MLILDTRDHYRKWTIKTISLLEYFVERCDHLKNTNTLPILLKLTMDTVINPKRLLHLIGKLSANSNSEFCAGEYHTSHLIQEKNSRWYVPTYIYNGDYDTFCHGSGYFISLPAARRLVEYSYCLKAVFYIDDGVITGIMRARLNIQLILVTEYYLMWKYEILKSAAKSENISSYGEYAVMHNDPQISKLEYERIWNYLGIFNML